MKWFYIQMIVRIIGLMKMKPQTDGKKYLDDIVKMCDESTASLELSTFISGCEFMVVLAIKEEVLRWRLRYLRHGEKSFRRPLITCFPESSSWDWGASSLPPVRGQGRLGLAYAQAYVAEFEPACIYKMFS